METAVDSGWSWSELDDIGPESPKVLVLSATL